MRNPERHKLLGLLGLFATPSIKNISIIWIGPDHDDIVLLWNKLPVDIRSAAPLNGFKKMIKTFLFNESL